MGGVRSFGPQFQVRNGMVMPTSATLSLAGLSDAALVSPSRHQRHAVVVSQVVAARPRYSRFGSADERLRLGFGASGLPAPRGRQSPSPSPGRHSPALSGCQQNPAEPVQFQSQWLSIQDRTASGAGIAAAGAAQADMTRQRLRTALAELAAARTAAAEQGAALVAARAEAASLRARASEAEAATKAMQSALLRARSALTPRQDPGDASPRFSFGESPRDVAELSDSPRADASAPDPALITADEAAELAGEVLRLQTAMEEVLEALEACVQLANDEAAAALAAIEAAERELGARPLPCALLELRRRLVGHAADKRVRFMDGPAALADRAPKT